VARNPFVPFKSIERPLSDRSNIAPNYLHLIIYILQPQFTNHRSVWSDLDVALGGWFRLSARAEYWIRHTVWTAGSPWVGGVADLCIRMAYAVHTYFGLFRYSDDCLMSRLPHFDQQMSENRGLWPA
jgi:hypothetical protein